MRLSFRLVQNPGLWLVASLSIAAGLKAWLVLGGWLPFNADEAVVALMARHILSGERPTFFYGQAYMGSLDAYFVAGAFAIFGEHVWAMRLVQSVLYLGFLGTTYFLGWTAFGRRQVGALAALLLAIPTVNLALYTTASLGGYSEALLLGNLVLLATLRIYRHWRAGIFPGPPQLWAMFGLFAGLGLWAFGLTLVYSLPAVIFLLAGGIRLMRPSLNHHQQKAKITGQLDRPAREDSPARLVVSLAIFSLAGLVGSMPLWLYAKYHGLTDLWAELSGGAIAGVEGLGGLSQIGRHLANLVLFGSTVTIGLRPPWSLTWLGLPLIPLVLLFWLAVVAYIVRLIRKGSDRAGPVLLAGVMATLMLVFIGSPFGADPSGRYFLPMAGPLAIFAADLILSIRKRFGTRAYAIAGMLVLYQLWGIIQSAMVFPPGITTQFYVPSQIDHRYDQALIEFLIQNGERRGYTNYWVAYPLAFLSEEALIFVPRLPYHLDFRFTARDDRYPPYDKQVEQSDRVAYITTHHPELDETLSHRFSELGITWKETQIGDYHVFFALSSAVRPHEIGLGATTDP